MNRYRFGTAALLIGGLTLAGCGLGSAKQADGPAVQPIAVAVTQAVEGTVSAARNASGQIEPILSIGVTAKVPGRVTAVHRQMGDVVQAGDLLAELEDRDAAAQLAQAVAGLAQAEAQRAEAARQYTRMAELLKAGAVSQQQVEQVQTQLSLAGAQVSAARAVVDIAAANYERTRITAPAAGVLSARLTDPGSLVGAGSVLFQLVDLSTVIMKTGVAERDVNAIRPGASVPVLVPALNQEFTGRVEAISPNMDPQTRAFQVRIALENPEGLLKGGMFAQVKLPVAAQQGIILPVGAVIERGGQAHLYVVTDGVARQRAVTVLLSSNGHLAVEGVTAGETVVTVGQNLLYDGAPVVVGGGLTP